MHPKTLWIATLGLTASLAACGDRSTTPAGSAASPAAVVQSLLVGSGATCRTDRDCGPRGGEGACILSTCFGLLTTENPAAQASIVERLTASPPAVKRELSSTLVRLTDAEAADKLSGPALVAAVRAMGAVLVDTDCGLACTRLRTLTESEDAQVGVQARLALAKRQDPTVITALTVDLREGSEQLKCAAGRALASYSALPQGAQLELGRTYREHLPCLKRAPQEPSSSTPRAGI